MKTKIVIGSLLACAVASPGMVLAQEEGVIEEIVVTGSLIRGTPEDAALPVEVHTAEDMRLEGTPTALEFAKSLTSSGPTSGEAYYFGGAELTGNVQYNLRGLGADKTLTLFNGRRVNQNTSVIPSIAIQRIEVLKDGAAVTYGADATGGVVNFITRSNFEGIEASASYKAINGSDGDYTMELMGGFGGENGNVLWAAEWNHRSELDSGERDFSSQPFAVNPAPHSTLTNLASYNAHAFGLPVTPTTATTSFAGGALNAPSGEFGDFVGFNNDYDTTSCEAVGGTMSTISCRYNYAPYYNIVEDNDIYRLYGQANISISDNMEFFMRMALSRASTPNAYGSPSQPVIRGTALLEGATSQFYVPRANPGFDEFAQRSGLATNAFYGAVHGVTAYTYRAFAHGGNTIFAHDGNASTPREIDNKYMHLSFGLTGEFENEMTYDFGVTLNRSDSFNTNPDIIAYRLQEALNGYGGPNCDTNGLDMDPNRFGTQPVAPGNPDPGTRPAGCQWFNPFASNFAGQPILGLANPNYDPTLANSDDLSRWLFDDRAQTTISDDITIDYVMSGVTPIELPGGAISWGAGLQLRNRHLRETVTSDFYNGSQPCVWPNEYGQLPVAPTDPRYNGCTPDRPGPFQFFDTNPPDSQRQDQRSAFTEFSIPVLDSLYFTAAARYEEFSGGLDTTVYKVSGQWNITDNLSFRGSYGTNYQAPGIAVIPGNVANGVNNYTIAGGAWLGAQTVTRSDIVPETATVWSTGIIWNSRGFTDDSDFRFILDYFDIETEDELGLLASANDIANAVYAGGVADCTHPLAPRITFNGGGCTQGAAPDFSNVTTEYGNGPGQHTAGFDIQANYSLPVFEGDLSFGLTATLTTTDENTAASLDGFQLNDGDDRLGDLNYATIGFASSELRFNLNTNYSMDIHNFRLVANFISGVDDERYDLDAFQNATGTFTNAQLVAARDAALTTTTGTVSEYGVSGDDWVSFDFHYTADFEWATINASIVNLGDQDPPESRQELGYDPRIGNPLGRTFEVGIRKEF